MLLPYIFFIIVLQLLIVLGGNGKPCAASLESQSDLHSGFLLRVKWGHKIAYFVFLAFISFIIVKQEAMCGSLESQTPTVSGP